MNHLRDSLKILDCGLAYDIRTIDRIMNNEIQIPYYCKYEFERKRKRITNLVKYILDYVSGGIKSCGISELKLHELYCDDNPDITEISHMKDTLKILSCRGISGISQNCISHLNLEKLICDDNPKIHDLNHMKNTLKVLECRQNSCHISKKYGNMVEDGGISELRLEKICFGGNPYITDLNHMRDTLVKLDLDGNYEFTGIRLSQKGISKLNLEKIYLSRHIELINLDHMAGTLQSLRLYNPIDLSKLRLRKLHICKGSEQLRKIIPIDHMKDTLSSLIIESDGYIDPR